MTQLYPSIQMFYTNTVENALHVEKFLAIEYYYSYKEMVSISYTYIQIKSFITLQDALVKIKFLQNAS